MSQFLENSLWKRVWTNRKTDYGMNEEFSLEGGMEETFVFIGKGGYC
jgi:hypothetical protein